MNPTDPVPLPPAEDWDPANFLSVAYSETDPASILDIYREELAEVAGRVTPDEFKVFSIVQYEDGMVPNITNAMTHNVYGVKYLGDMPIDPKWLTPALESQAQIHAQGWPEQASAFTNSRRYANTMLAILGSLATDTAVAAQERRPVMDLNPTVNQLLFEAFKPFTGVITAIQYTKAKTTKFISILPLGVRPSFKN